jgi:MFS transporter, SHS family, sialic acid transporter
MPDQDTMRAVRPSLAMGQRVAILVAAFMGWFFGGMQILITNLGMRAASLDLMGRSGMLDPAVYVDLNQRAGTLVGSELAQLTAWNTMALQWYAWFQCAFLFGAAAGGLLFGRLGDRMGRARALGLSIVWFAGFTGLAWFAQSPHQLLMLRFLACLGIGGTWPNGVALVSEVWSDRARPALSSAIGMAGNLGMFAMSSLAAAYAVTPASWRWVMLVNATPLLLGLVIWFFLPESPAWRDLAARKVPTESQTPPSVFRRPYLGCTLIGILLATIPLIGGWGSANWMMPWADEVGSQTGQDQLKAHIGMARALTSILGSLLAGILAVWIGRRRLYFLASLGALFAAQYSFWMTRPGDSGFLVGVAFLGVFNGLFFGWLPFFLPELFPVKIRSTGAGVSFNFGRILTALTIFATGALMGFFENDYARIGRLTSLIFLAGMVVICYAPDTSKREMAK